MTLALSLVAMVALLALKRVCKRQKLTPPPLRIPLIAAVLIPLLTALTRFMGDEGGQLVQKSLAMSISLMWAISLIRLMS